MAKDTRARPDRCRVSVNLLPGERDALKKAAEEQNTNGSALLRTLLIEHLEQSGLRDAGPVEIADREEIKRLLSQSARDGDVRAMTKLLELHAEDKRPGAAATGDEAPAPDAPTLSVLDELAQVRAARASG